MKTAVSNNNCSRGEISKLNFPKVASNLTNDSIFVVQGNFTPTDPFHLQEIHAEGLICTARKRLLSASAVQIGTMGPFTEKEINSLETVTAMSKIKKHVLQEDSWLKHPTEGIQPEETKKIQHILHTRRQQETILKANNISLDTESLSTVALERYLDNFIIDVCLQKYSANYQNSICLPCHAWQWVEQDNQFLEDKTRNWVRHISEHIRFVFLPVNFNNSHWGLIACDLAQQSCYFVDGLKWNLLQSQVCHFKKNMDVLARIFKFVVIETFWHKISHFKRFGMPAQPSDGDGSSSCGMGVILAAREIMKNGTLPTDFPWRFENMRYHRKKLIVKIASWIN